QFLKCMDHRQGQLLLLDVQSGGLPGLRSVAVVEEVVLDLEGDARKLPEGMHAAYLIGGTPGGAGTTGATGGDKAGGLLSDNGEVDLLTEVEVPALFKLQQFAFAHFAHGAANDPQQFELALIYCQQQAAAQQVVAHEHRDLVLPQRIDA